MSAVFSAGIAWSTLRTHGAQIVSVEARLEKAIEKAISELKAEHIRSAEGQGKRIGDLETHVDALQKWRYREDGRRRERADTKGIPIVDDETPT